MLMHRAGFAFLLGKELVVPLLEAAAELRDCSRRDAVLLGCLARRHVACQIEGQQSLAWLQRCQSRTTTYGAANPSTSKFARSALVSQTSPYCASRASRLPGSALISAIE